MAIIQISKIQQRSGNLVDLPQLDEAQLGWATDAKRLFIGKTTPNENVEVLTAYSNIIFHQINGSYGNLDINIANSNVAANSIGEVLAFDGTNWINAGGNAGGEINLGYVSNITIAGGAIGYVLETDGLGNLNWTPKGTLYTPIIGLSNATPIVMTVANTVPYVNAQSVTISGVEGNGNTILNSQIFYVKLENDYPTSGNVTLYAEPTLVTPIIGTGLEYDNLPNNLAIATAVVGAGGEAIPGGANTTIQFNNSGTFAGNAGFTFNKNTGQLNVPGNLVAVNGNLGNVAIANFFTGTLTTNAQPNITSLGTLTSLTVSGNVDGGNLVTTGIANIATLEVTSNANISTLKVVGTSNLGPVGNVTITGGVTGQYLQTDGLGVLTWQTISTDSISNGNSNVSIPSANGNINMSAEGNANIAVITGTGVNVNGYLTTTGVTNLGTVSNLIITGGSNGYYLQTNGSGNLTWASVPSGNGISNGTSNVTIYSSGGNIAASVGGNANVVVVTGTGANIAGTLNVTGNITGSNVAASNFIGTGVGSPTINSSGSLSISATSGVTIDNLISLSTGSNITPGNITGNWTLTTGSSLQATYADLAEYYEADAHYTPGTVLEFGGDKEVTIAKDGTTKVAGVISTNPAYAMNANCKGISTAIALQGRVPTKVRGTIHKGDMMISAGNGYAKSWNNPAMGTVIGKALENFDGVEGIIEIAVGRL